MRMKLNSSLKRIKTDTNILESCLGQYMHHRQTDGGVKGEWRKSSKEITNSYFSLNIIRAIK
jgi:hypothetical protein